MPGVPLNFQVYTLLNGTIRADGHRGPPLHMAGMVVRIYRRADRVVRPYGRDGEGAVPYCDTGSHVLIFHLPALSFIK